MKKRPPTAKSKGKNASGCTGIGLCLFSSIFIIVGLGLVVKQAQFWRWKETPCQIGDFRINDSRSSDHPFEASVTYSYSWNGQRYSGRKISSKKREQESNYESLVRLEQKLTKRGTCYVDANNPTEAILRRSSGEIWGGLVFAGAGGLFFAIGIAVTRKPASNPALSAKDTSSMDLKNGPIGYTFFGIITLIGLGIFSGFVWPTAKKFISAKTWEPTEATVIWSTVRSHSSDDGTTYSPDIFYRYRFQDEDHRSNNYGFVSGSSSGSSSKRAIVNSFPSGHEFTCYVNPDKPWQAVIKRSLGWSALLGLIPLPFLGFGIWGLSRMTFRRSMGSEPGKQSPRSISSNEPAPLQNSLQRNGSKKGWKQFLFHLLFAFIWCGVVLFAVFLAWEKAAEGKPDWFMNIFLIPFVLVGLVAALSLPHSFIAIFSPRFEFELRDPRLKPGLSSKFRWRKSGGSGELTKLTLTLFGQEQASYRQGTNTATATSLFHQRELLTTTNLPEILASECDFVVPPDSPPTFESKNNKIRWFIKIHAEVKRRPDVHDEIALTLHPLEESDFR